LAQNIDPKVRGPYGIARIELKDKAVPQARKPFRMSEEREQAMNQIVEKCLKRGWIRPSKSEWASQAFVVPKARKDGQKDWRMVVDYRY